MTMRKIIIRFCRNIVRSVMKSINMQGGFLFCAGWNFPKSVSVTSCLLERREYRDFFPGSLLEGRAKRLCNFWLGFWVKR